MSEAVHSLAKRVPKVLKPRRKGSSGSSQGESSSPGLSLKGTGLGIVGMGVMVGGVVVGLVI